MLAHEIFDRFDAKQTSPGKWRARCPSHGSRGLSLALKETNEGNTLVHCFHGCTAAEVLGSVGLKTSDLYRDKLVSDGKPFIDKDTRSRVTQGCWFLLLWNTGGYKTAQPADKERYREYRAFLAKILPALKRAEETNLHYAASALMRMKTGIFTYEEIGRKMLKLIKLTEKK